MLEDHGDVEVVVGITPAQVPQIGEDLDDLAGDDTQDLVDPMGTEVEDGAAAHRLGHTPLLMKICHAETDRGPAPRRPILHEKRFADTALAHGATDATNVLVPPTVLETTEQHLVHFGHPHHLFSLV